MTVPVPDHVRQAAANVPTSLDRHVMEQALALYDAGWTPMQIAERLIVSRTTVNYWRKRSGLPSNGTRNGMQRLPTAEIARTVELYESGLTIDEVATRMGRSFGAIQRRLVRAGVRMRPSGHLPGTRRAHAPDGYVTSREASDALGVVRETICRQAAAGKIPGARQVPNTLQGPDLVWAIPKAYVDARRVTRLQVVRKPEENAGPVRLVKGRQDRRLPAGPLAAWVERQPQDEATLADLAGVPQRRLYAIRTGEQQTVTLWTADRLLTANGARLEDVWPDVDELLAA